MRHSTVLVVDDDLGTCETFAAALQLAGFEVSTAASGGEALSKAHSGADLVAVIDLRLPDMSGLQLVRMLKETSHDMPFVVVSAFLSTAATVEAVRLGAHTVMDKPVSVDEVCAAVLSAASTNVRLSFDVDESRQALRRVLESHRFPKSASERWALLVLRGCEADHDLKTITIWARAAGVSYSVLREACWMIHISAQDSRDLTRALRSLLNARRYRCGPEMFVDIQDGRTFRKFVERAGLISAKDQVISLDQFLASQQFVDNNHEAMRVLRLLVTHSTSV